MTTAGGWERRGTPALHAAVWVGALAPVAGLALGRPELVAVGAPLLVLVAVALATVRRPDLDVAVELAPSVAAEGDEVELRLGLRSSVPAGEVRLHLDLPPALDPLDGAPDLRRRPVTVRPGNGAGADTVTLALACRRWGAHHLGAVRVEVGDALGTVEHVRTLPGGQVLRVHPRAERVRTLVRPWSTTTLAGSQISRRTGDAIEFAGIRPFRPGDRARSINWRATARRGEPWVTEHHLERNADVVLFLDTFAELGVAPDTTLDLTVRAADALARRYLAQRDRLGLVVFGGYLTWLLPRLGTRQVHRVAATLIDAAVHHSDAWKDLDVLPRRTLPAGSFVVALSPLLDRRTVTALADLRARGYDVAVIDVLPSALGPRPARPGPADRLLDLRRAAVRSRYHRLGVGVGAWRPDEPLEAALAEVAAFRRAVPRRR